MKIGAVLFDKSKAQFAVILLVTLISVMCGCSKTPASSIQRPLGSAEPTIIFTPTTSPSPSPSPSPTPSPTPVSYTLEEKTAAKGILALMKVLKNPESLQVHHIRFYSEGDLVDGIIEISAQNGFGGMDRKTYSVMTIQTPKPDAWNWYDKEFGITVTDMEHFGVVYDYDRENDYHKELDKDRVMELVKSGDVN